MVQPSISQEEIDAALDSGGQEEVFSQTVLQGPGHAQARQELSDIQERRRDIDKLLHPDTSQQVHSWLTPMRGRAETCSDDSRGWRLTHRPHRQSKPVNGCVIQRLAGTATCSGSRGVI